MEYCIRIFENGNVRRRGSRIVGVLLALLMAAGMVCELPALEFKESNAVHKMVYGKYTGKKLLPYAENIKDTGALDVFENIAATIPVKSNIEELSDRNREPGTVTNSLDAEKTDFLSDVLLRGVEISGPDLSRIEISLPETPTGNFTPPVIPDIPNIPSGHQKPSVPDTPAEPNTPIVPETPIVPYTPSIDDNPTVPPENIVPDNPDEEAPDIPDDGVDPGTDTDDPVIEQPAGFTVNEDGMICSYDPSAGIVNEGRLTLPSEGCTGIARGAFAGVSAEIYELFIPSNIVNIEPGALGEMTDLGWIELTGPNENFVCMEGMLLDSSMTTLLAFPCGRIGTYVIPANVTRLEDYSFLNTTISKLDMIKCGAVEVGSNVFGENGGNGITIKAPRDHLEHYQNVFEGTGATVQ